MRCRNHDRDNSHDSLSRGEILSSALAILATVLATFCRERPSGFPSPRETDEGGLLPLSTGVNTVDIRWTTPGHFDKTHVGGLMLFWRSPGVGAYLSYYSRNMPPLTGFLFFPVRFYKYFTPTGLGSFRRLELKRAVGAGNDFHPFETSRNQKSTSQPLPFKGMVAPSRQAFASAFCFGPAGRR